MEFCSKVPNLFPVIRWLPINYSRGRRNNEGREKEVLPNPLKICSSTLLKFRVVAITTAFCLLEGKETERERERERERGGERLQASIDVCSQARWPSREETDGRGRMEGLLEGGTRNSPAKEGQRTTKKRRRKTDSAANRLWKKDGETVEKEERKRRMNRRGGRTGKLATGL